MANLSIPAQLQKFVVIGSGLAGYGAVRELRKCAPDASITVITRDDGHFYSKPALSTALAKGKHPEKLITMPGERMIEAHAIDLLSGKEVLSIDRASRQIVLADRTIAYDALILALGAQAIPLPFAVAPDAPIVSVNSLDDYVRFRECLNASQPVVVIGAGLVGSELANDLAVTGHRVSVVDLLGHPLGRLVPPEMGDVLRDKLAGAGVQWHLCRSVTSIDSDASGVRVVLDSSEVLEAGLVVSAIGLRPDIRLAVQAGLDVNRGILVDRYCRTSDPAIYALGDCAQYPHGLSAYVTPIMTAARTVATNAAADGSAAQCELCFPPLSVQVKTTMYPMVLLPPPAESDGAWSAFEKADDNTAYLFKDCDGDVLGYALSGDFCQRRGEFDRLTVTGKLLNAA